MMIRNFDETFTKLLAEEFGRHKPGQAEKVLPFDLSFAMPKKEFEIRSPDKPTLNCYLYDISEDRELRNTQPLVERKPDGTVETTSAPVRIKLSYCITAWSPVKGDEQSVSAELEEHELLSQVLAVLLRYPELPPEMLQGELKKQNVPLPTSVVMPSDKKSTSEFWNAIGGQLRPSLDYKVTIPIIHRKEPISGPMVTTRVAAYAPALNGQPTDELIQIGGFVTNNAAPPEPIPNAWVLLTETGLANETGPVQITDDQGQFSFSQLHPGAYHLRVRAMGFAEGQRPIEVPGNEYNLRLTRN